MTKFKIGDKVRYKNEWVSDWVYGTVCEGVYLHSAFKGTEVWAYWNGGSSPTWVNQQYVELVTPKIKRNLPAWW